MTVPLSPADIERFGSDPAVTFRGNLAKVEARITNACGRAGRPRSEIRLLPITKTVPAHILRYAYAAGLRDFGENKIQEALAKRDALTDLDVRWSIVGHLQTNKAKHLCRFADEFHALDSMKLAALLDANLEREDRTLDVFVQVNTSGEDSKFGLRPDELLPFLDGLGGYSRLRPVGLMTLAMFSPDPSRVRECFALLRGLREQAIGQMASLTRLSMGMSGDYEIAIEEGADVVRVGQAIFGERPIPDSHYWPDSSRAPERLV